MNWPIPRNVVAIDFADTYFAVSKARYSFGKLVVIHQEIKFSEEKEDWEEVVSNFKFDPEDIVVTSLDMGLTIFVDVFIPLKLKKMKEILSIGKAEAARTMGISMDDISVSLVGRHMGKSVFAVAKSEDIDNNVVKYLRSLGTPEPDIVIPDATKYLQAVSFPVHGRVVYLVTNFFKNYVSIFLVIDGQVAGVRNMYSDLKDVFKIVKDRFGLSIPEIYVMGEILDDDLRNFMKTGFVNLAMEINRELVQLLRSEGELTLENVDLVVLISDPSSFSSLFSEAASEVLKTKVYSENIKELSGLLLRGGREFGKVESIQQKG